MQNIANHGILSRVMENTPQTGGNILEEEGFIGPVTFNPDNRELDSRLRAVFGDLGIQDQMTMLRAYAEFDLADNQAKEKKTALQRDFLPLKHDQQKELLAAFRLEEISDLFVKTLNAVGIQGSEERQDVRDLLSAYLGFAYNNRLRSSRTVESRYFHTTISDSRREEKISPYELVFLYEKLVEQKDRQTMSNDGTEESEIIIDQSETGPCLEELCRTYLKEMAVVDEQNDLTAEEVEAKEASAYKRFLPPLRAYVITSGEEALFASPELLEGLLKSLNPNENKLTVGTREQGRGKRARQIEKAGNLLAEITESGNEVYIVFATLNLTEPETELAVREGWLTDAVIEQGGSQTIRLGPMRGIRGFNASNAALELVLDNASNIALRKLPASYSLALVEANE